MKLNINAPINTTSYGYVSSYFMSHLKKLGWDIRHLGIGPNSPDDVTAELLRGISNEFHYDAPCLKIWHQNQLCGFTGSPKIGFPIFELEDFSKEELHSLNYPDLLFVCSNWAKDVLSKYNIRSEVVPLGYDPNIFKVSNMPKKSTTVFANFGKWEIRKGHDILIRAFEAAFTPKDDVLLVMCPTNQFLPRQKAEEWENLYTKGKMGNQVQLIPRVMNQKEVYNIMEQVDCGVFPARAEGWNLEGLELLATGRYCIMTNCTGHTEFVDKDVMLINMPEKLEIAYDGVFFDGTRHWRSFGKDQFDQLVHYLRDFHINRPIIPNSSFTRVKKFTWDNSALTLSDKLKGV